MLICEEMSTGSATPLIDGCSMLVQIQHLQADMGVFKVDNSQNSEQIKEIQKILSDLRQDVSCMQMSFTSIHQEDESESFNKSIKLEFMQEFRKMQDQVKSDINAMNLRLTDIEENMAPQVNDLQHRIEACALELQSICENIPAHFIEDSELWFRKLEELDKKMQLNLSNLSKTTTNICNLQGKVDMNSVLVSQLFQERSKSAKAPVEDVIKPRPRSRRRRAVSQDSRAPSLDVIAENACHSASLEANVTSTSASNSVHGSCRSSHLDELRGGSTNSRVTEPPSRSKTHLQLHEFSLSGSSVPSRIPTLFSSLSTTDRKSVV